MPGPISRALNYTNSPDGGCQPRVKAKTARRARLLFSGWSLEIRGWFQFSVQGPGSDAAVGNPTVSVAATPW